MAAPKQAITIGIKSSTSISEGEFVKVTNFTSGGTLRGTVDSNGEAILTISPDFNFTWKNNDVCSIEVSGRLIGSKTVSITKGGISTTVTTSADTASPAVDL